MIEAIIYISYIVVLYVLAHLNRWPVWMYSPMLVAEAIQRGDVKEYIRQMQELAR